MRLLVRLFVLWLVALSLPLQGVAAATMLHCAQVHATFHAHGHHHHQASASEHGHGGVAHQHDDSHGGCSACASCCGAAALPAMPLALTSPTVVRTAPPRHSPASILFLTEGPERPPRIVLA